MIFTQLTLRNFPARSFSPGQKDSTSSLLSFSCPAVSLPTCTGESPTSNTRCISKNSRKNKKGEERTRMGIKKVLYTSHTTLATRPESHGTGVKEKTPFTLKSFTFFLVLCTFFLSLDGVWFSFSFFLFLFLTLHLLFCIKKTVWYSTRNR